MFVKRLLAAVLMLGVAFPSATWAESESQGLPKRFRPKSSIINIFGAGKKRSVEVPFFDPEPSVSGNEGPSPDTRLIPVPNTEGNLTYVPEKLVDLHDGKLKDAAPSDPLPLAIYDLVKSDEPGPLVLPAERKAILAYYSGAGFKPLWTTPEGITDRARDLVALLRDAAAEGLDPADYTLESLGGFDLPPGLFAGDPQHLARFDLELTAKAMVYARHASGGRLVPDRLTTYNDIDPPRVDPGKAMNMLSVSPFAASWLASLEPTLPAYGIFKAALAELRNSADAETDEPIPPARQRLKVGRSDERIPLLRLRLERLGLLKPLANDTTSLPPQFRGPTFQAARAVFDADVETALKALQKKNNLRTTGTLDQLTLRLLNNHGAAKEMARLAANMERLRWLPRDLGERYVFVNQAAFQLWVVDHGNEIWRTNVVVGKQDTQTTAFFDQMETVVFNPSWGVPPSILTNEMLPILWRDPSYLDRKGFAVVDRSGRRVKSSSVNWAAYGSNAPYSIMQPPGDDNALGEVKFLFPNSHNIYMHDTPTRQLFSRPVRSFSHGCVRVENPRRFAEIVLGFSTEEVAKRIDSGRSQSVSLKQKLPVYLSYFTAWPAADGHIEYFPDVYGRDTPIETVFGQQRVALR